MSAWALNNSAPATLAQAFAAPPSPWSLPWWGGLASMGMAAGDFPAQIAGLRVFYGGMVRELCLVAAADAPAGDTPMVRKGGTTYALYLVETADPSASSVRIQTAGGTKAVRLKT